MQTLMALTWNLAHSPSSLSSRSSWVSGTCTSKRSNTRYLSLQADKQDGRKNGRVAPAEATKAERVHQAAQTCWR